jgi:hypothetical protein
MTPKVYFIRSTIEDGEKKISDKAKHLFKEAALPSARKTYRREGSHREKGNRTYKAPCLKGLIDDF